MKRSIHAILLGASMIVSVPVASSLAQPVVGGAPMYPTKNIVENASQSKDHTTLVTAVKAAGLVSTLEGPGPFTVFAPTNEAFAALPSGTVEKLLKPEHKAKLTKILTYHVVPKKLDLATLKTDVTNGGGAAKLTTAEGGVLTVTMSGDTLYVTDAKGHKATVTSTDVPQSNGDIYVINKVLMP